MARQSASHTPLPSADSVATARSKACSLEPQPTPMSTMPASNSSQQLLMDVAV